MVLEWTRITMVFFLFCCFELPQAYSGRDWDVDMQIDVTSLQTLAEEYNSTVWTAVPANAGPDAQPRDYLLDVNPYWMERVHGDGLNFIDARFIDTTNGLYVDITALTELDPTNLPNVVSCKNYHNYNLNDLYPLRETLFEGTLAKVPYNYKTILAEEYGQRSLILADFNGYILHLSELALINSYVWSRDKSQWVPKREAKSPYRINSLPSTPSTRVIPEDELPYYEDPASPVIPEEPEVLSHLPPPHHSQSSSSNIEIEELPSDKIDTPTSGKGNILTTLKDYLTLFWRN